MADNNQMIVDREAGDPDSQPQQAQSTSETTEIQQRSQAVSTN